MSTTDTDALKERIARALFEVRDDAYDLDKWEDLDSTDRERWMCDAAAVLPLVAVEARKAKAEAFREAADGIDLDEIAEEWSQGPGNRDDMHWAAGNAASSVVLALHDRAAEYESGDSDERR